MNQYCNSKKCPLKGQFQGQQTRGERGNKTLPAFAARLLIQQTRGECGEDGQGLILSFEESVQNKNCPIFDAD